MKLKKPKKGALVSAFAAVAIVAAAAGGLAYTTLGGDAGSPKPADVASSSPADRFGVNRQIDFVSTVTGEDLLSVKGLCNLDNDDKYDKDGFLSVTCETGKDVKGNPQYVNDTFIMGKDLIMITGICSLENNNRSGAFSVICRTDENNAERFVGEALPDDGSIACVVQQSDPAAAGYSVKWKSGALTPAFHSAGGIQSTPYQSGSTVASIPPLIIIAPRAKA